MPESEDESGLTAARAGDGTAFRRLTDGHRAEIRVHCYRLLGSTHDAEDAVQETWIRAWRGLAAYEGRASFRAWLYRIATNVCLDEIDKRPRRTLPIDHGGPAEPGAPMEAPLSDQVWIEPMPDAWIPTSAPGAEARYTARESVALAFTATLQLLPPKQRAVLILRDVVGLEASEVGEQLDLTVSSVNSALNRARTTLESRARPGGVASTVVHSELLANYVRAWESADVGRLLSVIREDACLSMPPRAEWYRGHAAIAAFFTAMIKPDGLRLVSIGANGQPAFGVYRREPDGAYLPFAIQVVTLEDGRVADSVTFIGEQYFPVFGLPGTLPSVL